MQEIATAFYSAERLAMTHLNDLSLRANEVKRGNLSLHPVEPLTTPQDGG
jgi:hypothetical protein